MDIEQIRKWARAGSTQLEMAQRLHISLATLKRRLALAEYRHEYDSAVAELKISLRTKQVVLATRTQPEPKQRSFLGCGLSKCNCKYVYAPKN